MVPFVFLFRSNVVQVVVTVVVSGVVKHLSNPPTPAAPFGFYDSKARPNKKASKSPQRKNIKLQCDL